MFILTLCVIRLVSELSIPVYSEKQSFYFQDPANYNFAVFGSSRMYRQIDPLLLDSLLEEHNISTFNFATAGAYNPESYYLYENFIRKIDENAIEFAILELQKLNLISEKNIKTTRGNYWNTIPILKYSLNYISNSNYTTESKNVIRKKYLKSFFYRCISFHKIYILKHYLFKSKINMKGKNGYYPLEDEMKNNALILDRYQTFHKDTSAIIERIHAASQIGSLGNENAFLNKAHLKYLQQLIIKSADKGIHLIFFISPRLELDFYTELIPIYNYLPKEHVVEIANYNKYKQLYLTKNSFDVGHLNTTGAGILSTYLAEQLEQIMKIEK